MARVARQMDWMEQMIGLTVAPPGDGSSDALISSNGAVARLAVTAWAVADAAEDQELAAAFAAVPGGAAAQVLAADLARSLPLGAARNRPRIALHGDALAKAYMAAIRSASGAVYHCKRVQHAAGSCWFSVRGPQEDRCGQVLAVAHHLGCHN